MSKIIPFNFEKLPIRVVTNEEGEPLFVGKDICDALGYKDATTAFWSHCKGAQLLHFLRTSGGVQKVRCELSLLDLV
jgi:prophage antirepressor-like protein